MKLIDKQKALDALMAERKYLIARGQESAEHILTHHAYNIIDEQPIIESRPKGRWIRDFDGNEFHTYCSNCNEEFYEEDLWTVGDEKLPNYCPNCGSYNGADTRGER